MRLLAVVKALDRTVDTLGRIVAWLTLMMVIVGVAIVIMRYALSIVFVWLQEMQIYMHAAVFAVGASYAMLHEDHVRLDFFYSRMTVRTRGLVNLLAAICFVVPLAFLLFTASWHYVLNSWAMLEGSQHMRGLNAVFILKSFIWVFAGGLLLQSISVFLRSAVEIATGEPLYEDQSVVQPE